MSTTGYNTFLLSRSQWDLCIDSSGNIAMATPSYSLAQDVASACRLFLGELWYDTTQGVSYWQKLLGQNPTTSQIAAAFNAAALTVPSVVTANTVITSIQDGKVSGQVQFTTSDGTSTEVNF